MNVQIEWEGGVPEPLASIYLAMAGDGEAMLRAAQQLWGDDLVEGISAAADRKVQRVEDILDDKDPFERIEDRLEAVLSASRRREPATVQPDEMSSRDAANYLGISPDTLNKLFRNGQLARRNASPPGSGKPRYRYRIADLDRMKREGFRLLAPSPSTPSTPKRQKRSTAKFKSRHLDLD